MDINHRIFQELKQRGLKSKELSLKTGIAVSTISEWKKGVSLKPDMIIRVAEFLHVSTDYLLTGSESRSSLAPEEAEMLVKFRRLDAGDKNVIKIVIDNFIGKLDKNGSVQ